MKKQIGIFVAAVLAFNMNQAVMAHAEHDLIDGQQAIELAVKTTKKLTFKDLGFSVGKLDKHWAAVTKSDFKLVQEDVDFFIINVTDSAGNALVFKVDAEGHVEDVTVK